jgi:hypothetical protein
MKWTRNQTVGRFRGLHRLHRARTSPRRRLFGVRSSRSIFGTLNQTERPVPPADPFVLGSDLVGLLGKKEPWIDLTASIGGLQCICCLRKLHPPCGLGLLSKRTKNRQTAKCLTVPGCLHTKAFGSHPRALVLSCQRQSCRQPRFAKILALNCSCN